MEGTHFIPIDNGVQDFFLFLKSNYEDWYTLLQSVLLSAIDMS